MVKVNNMNHFMFEGVFDFVGKYKVILPADFDQVFNRRIAAGYGHSVGIFDNRTGKFSVNI